MSKYRARVYVKSKEEVPDPKRFAVKDSLKDYPLVTDARTGKYFEIPIELPDGSPRYLQAYNLIHRICRTLLTNPVYEEYCFQIERDDGHCWSQTSWFSHNGKAWKRSVIRKS